MNLRRTIAPVCLAALLWACGGASHPAPPTTTPEPPKTEAPAADAAAPEGDAGPAAEAPKAPKRPRRAHGPGGMFLHAAMALELKDAQKDALKKLEATLEQPAPLPEMKELHEGIVAGVKEGKLDKSKIDPKMDAVTKAMAAHHAKEIEVLNGIHAALEPAQRKALAEAVRKTHAERAEKHAAKGRGPGQAGKHHLERLTKQLDLDDAQQKKVEALLKAGAKDPKATMAEAKKRMESLLTAFEKDKFDASKLEIAKAGAKKNPMKEHVELFAKLLPILKAEQREKLAATMSGGHGPHEGKGPHGDGSMHHGGDDDDDDNDD